MGNYVNQETLEYDSSKQGWLVSILELGAWLGTMYSGFLAEIFSRKYAILMNVCIFVLGVIIQTTSISAGHSSILAGRFITGMGVGSLSMIVPMYNAEIAPPEVRGALVGLQQLSITLGIMISFWIDYGTNYIGGTGRGQKEAAWLLPLCLQLVPALILGVGMVFMPFSPRWLVHHEREADARRVLSKLRDLPEDHELLELEFAEIKAQSLFEKKSLQENFPHLQEMTAWNTIKLQFVAIASLFKSKPMFKRVIVATMTMFFQQWTGINAVLYYAPVIFGKLGLSSNSVSLLATGVVGIVMFIATIPAVMYVDRWGRKPTLIIGAIGMAVCHIIIVSCFQRNQTLEPVSADHFRPSLPPRINITGRLTRLLAGVPSPWSGSSSSTLATLGALAPGSSWPKSGRFPTVRMASLLAPRPTGTNEPPPPPFFLTNMLFSQDEQLHRRPSHPGHARVDDVRHLHLLRPADLRRRGLHLAGRARDQGPHARGDGHPVRLRWRRRAREGALGRGAQRGRYVGAAGPLRIRRVATQRARGREARADGKGDEGRDSVI